MPLPDRQRLDEYAAKGIDLGRRTLKIAPEQLQARALDKTGRRAEGGPRVLTAAPGAGPTTSRSKGSSGRPWPSGGPRSTS